MTSLSKIVLLIDTFHSKENQSMIKLTSARILSQCLLKDSSKKEECINSLRWGLKFYNSAVKLHSYKKCSFQEFTVDTIDGLEDEFDKKLQKN